MAQTAGLEKKKKKKEDPDHLIKVINIPGNMAQKAIKGNPISKPCSGLI